MDGSGGKVGKFVAEGLMYTLKKQAKGEASADIVRECLKDLDIKRRSLNGSTARSTFCHAITSSAESRGFKSKYR